MKTNQIAPKRMRVKSWAEIDLAGLSDYQQNTVERILRQFLAKMQEIFDRATAELDITETNRPKRCSTCAFIEKNDWPGFVATAYSLCHGIVNQTHFICHANQPEMLKNRIVDLSKLIPCRGYVSVLACYPKEMREVALLTMQAIEKVKKGPRTNTHTLVQS